MGTAIAVAIRCGFRGATPEACYDRRPSPAEAQLPLTMAAGVTRRSIAPNRTIPPPLFSHLLSPSTAFAAIALKRLSIFTGIDSSNQGGTSKSHQ